MQWYMKHARPLPWRGVGDAYLVWISEVMLQQTTTHTVQGYFDRFVKSFPTVQSLAESDLDFVNLHWEGLGYYRRCALLHKAAKEIAERFRGEFPRQFSDALSLPGIGRYTAGAVLSIAYDQRLPILEANTLRLHARLLAERGHVLQGAANARLWQFAEDILPRTGSGQFNQALMELGSLVCTAKLPKCTECPTQCPVFVYCESAKQGLQGTIPTLPAKTMKTDRTEAALLVRQHRREGKGKILLVRYSEGRRWAGLWDFPRAESDASSPTELASDFAFQTRLSELTGRHLQPGKFLCSVKHSVTRYRITLFFCEGFDAGQAEAASPSETRWVSKKELQTLPLNSTARRLADQVADHTAR